MSEGHIVIQQAVILAAGRGTRLGLLTKDRPKSMLPVLGKPMMARVMDRLREAGIRRFVVVIGDQEGAIAAYLTSSWHPETETKFAIQAMPTGTVDALRLAAAHIDGPFLVTSVDNLTSTEHVSATHRAFQRHTRSDRHAQPASYHAGTDPGFLRRRGGRGSCHRH